MYQRKSDGKWVEKIAVGGKYKVIYGKTKAEVKKKLLEYKEKTDNGLTVSEALEVWQREKEETVSYKTLEGYKAPVKRINAYLGDCRLKDVTPAQVQAMIKDIAAKGYKRTTVQRPLDVLNMVFDYFITQPETNVTANPCTAVRLPSGLKQQRRELMSREDAEIVKNSCSAEFGLFAYLLLYTGLRKGEALALRYEDIRDGRIYVTSSVSWQPNKPVIKSTKTAAGQRTVPVVDALKAVLPTGKGYIFSADGGKNPLTQIQFRHRWEGYCKAVGLSDAQQTTHKNERNGRTYTTTKYTPRISPHQLRHEFVSFCFDAGLDEQDTQVIVGHASSSTTREVYNHIKESRKISSANKLNDFINGI